jgi:anti-sigma regulatory factor (Ser/Thr protein kinase)
MSEPGAAWRARGVVRSVLEGWQVGGLADDVVTCVSELVANAYEHADSAVAELFVLWVPGSFLSAEVRDQDPRMPRRTTATDLTVAPFALDHPDADQLDMAFAESGRGLVVVEALCDHLWWRPDSSGGKVVRCHWRLKAATDIARSNPRSSGYSEG